MHYAVYDQLQKVKRANLPEYDINTMEMVIPKSGTSPSTFQIGKRYIIQVEPYIVKPFEGFTLHDNWNKGISPKHYIMKALICEIMGKMVKIQSVGYDINQHKDINDEWEGWLPKSSFKILEEV